MRINNVIFGILAVQLRLVEPDALGPFVSRIEEDEEFSLSETLRAQDLISEADLRSLQHLLETLLHTHQGNHHGVLTAFGGPEAVEEIFSKAVRDMVYPEVSSSDKTLIGGSAPTVPFEKSGTESTGRYSKGSEYARGGIGRILLVHDEQIGRDVILKELLPEHAVSPTASTLKPAPPDTPTGVYSTPMRQSAAMIARFLQEAKVTGQLEHPSIVPVYELGTRPDGQLYYTMKLVRGETLGAAIEKRKSAQERLGLLRPFLDVCQAVAYAHSRGVVHRDLKPSNIMVGEFGECVVLDWGLAKISGDRDSHREAMVQTLKHLEVDDDIGEESTRDKDVLGTPLYMSPEQARGEIDAVGEHSDVYSLVVVLFEILTGERPHPWTNARDTIHRVGSLPAPSVTSVAPRTPPELGAICDKALSFDAAARYPTAAELAKDVRSFLEGAVVGAYDYRLQDKLRRIYLEHKATINSALAALTAVVVIGIVSYVNIYQAREAEEAARLLAEQERATAEEQRDIADTQRALANEERDRAEAAEALTADEKYVSQIRLAEAYLNEGRVQAAEDTLLETDPARRHIEWGYLVARCNQELATLEGHTDIVNIVEALPDGKRVVTFSGDDTGRLWDVAGGQSLYEWKFPATRPRVADVSPTGNLIAAGAFDGSLYLMDPATGDMDVLLPPTGSQVNRCTFSEDGLRLITCHSSGRIRLWDLEQRTLVSELDQFPAGVQWVGFSPEAESVLVNLADDSLLRVETATGAELVRSHVSGLVWGQQGDAILVAHLAEMHIIDARSLERVHTLSLESNIRRARIYDGGAAVLAGTENGLVWLWNGLEGAVMGTFNMGTPISNCRRSPDGTRIAAVAQKGGCAVWNGDSQEIEFQLSGSRSHFQDVEFTNDASLLVTSEYAGQLRVWRPDGVPHEDVIDDGSSSVSAMTRASEKNILAIARDDGTVQVIDTDSSTSLLTFHRQPTTYGSGLSLNADGTRLGVVVDEFLPVVIDVASGDILAEYQGHSSFVSGMALTPNGNRAITTSWDGDIHLWDVETESEIHSFTGQDISISFVAISNDGRMAVTTSDDHTAVVWDLESLTEGFRIEHTGRVVRACFSADGAAVATASGDGTLQVWDTASRTMRFQASGQLERVLSIDFSADRRRLIASSSSTAQIWDAQLGLRLAALETPLKMARFANFGSSNHEIYLANRSGRVTRIRTVPAANQTPPTSRETLLPVLETFSETLSALEQDTTQTDSGLRIRFCRLSDLLALVETWQAATPAPYETIPVDADAALMPLVAALGLTPGDIVTMNGDGLENLRSRLTALENNPSGATEFIAIDLPVVRSGEALRFRYLTAKPIVTEKSVTLETTRAKALLKYGARMLRMEQDTILQVNKERSELILHRTLSPGTLNGYWILAPSNRMWRPVHSELGLHPCGRITAISGQTIDSLPMLVSLCETGLNYLDTSDTFEVSLTVSCGMFTETQVTFTGSSSN